MRIWFVALLLVVLISASAFALNKTSNYKCKPGLPGDSLEANRLKYMNEVLQSIKGKEKLPADSVFKNLKVIKGISAEHLLWMMNWGWSTELGVTCSYCHVVGKWESDSLVTKEITRGMWNMRQLINGQVLPGITGKNYGKDQAVS